MKTISVKNEELLKLTFRLIYLQQLQDNIVRIIRPI